MSRQIVASQDADFEEARRTLEKLKSRSQSAQRSLTRFEQSDLPQYHSWLSDNFGSRFEEVNRLRSEFVKLANLVELAEDLRFVCRYAEGECYRRAKYCDENPDAPNPYDDSFWARVAGEQPDEPEADGDPYVDNLFRELFGEAAAAFGIDPEEMESEWEALRGGSAGEEAASAPKPRIDAPEKGDLKKTYRQLARQLHPDHRDQPESEKQDALDQLWHRAQDAYTRGDLQSLRQIQALIETEVRGIDQNTSLDHLRHAIDGIRAKLRPIERDVRAARQSPAWMFSKKPKNRAQLKSQIDLSLRMAVHELRQELHPLRHERDRLEKLAAKCR